MSNNQVEKRRGYGTEDRPLIGDLWKKDSKCNDSIVTEVSGHDPDNTQVNYKRFYDKDYAAAEVENIWKKQWLQACREEDIPNIGDREPFNIGPLSFIIIRTTEDSFKAFYNSCMHRGAMLCDKAEGGDNIRCPYHGWEWNIDGALNRIPSHWDFSEMNRTNGKLREVKLERWGGFIFINADPDSLPLSEYLGLMPEHFKCYPAENRYTAIRFRKTMKANWKIVQEAFQESYHLTATHPEAVPFNGDSQVQYDIWRTAISGIGRTATPGCVPSINADDDATMLSAATVLGMLLQSWHYPNVAPPPPLDPEGDVRMQIADWHRNAYEETYGRKIEAPDAVLLDSLLYFTFPNFCLWLSEAVPLAYRFVPHETDPEQSYFDVRLLMPYPEGEARPVSAPCVELGPDDSIAEVLPGLNFLGLVFDQDTSNMPRVQRGIHAADPARPYAQLGSYQESVIQHWHEILDEQMAKG